MAIRGCGYNCNCDVCDAFHHIPATTEAAARRLLVLHGWELDELDLCKPCVEKRAAGHEGTLLLIAQLLAARSAAESGSGG